VVSLLLVSVYDPFSSIADSTFTPVFRFVQFVFAFVAVSSRIHVNIRYIQSMKVLSR